MVSPHVVLVSNDVVPGQGLPVAAPGLRVRGLAEGLASHGVDVEIAVVEHVVARRWRSRVPPPTPPGARMLRVRQLPRFLRSRRPDAVVMTNSNYMEVVDPDVTDLLVYDFFAPKALERVYQGEDGRYPVEEIAALREQKIAALRSSDAVIVNGAKKVPYVYGWLMQTDRDVRTIPVEVVNMCLPPVARDPDGDRVRFVVSGYLQPWSRPGPWAGGVVPLLDDGKVDLDLLVASHWGGDDTETPMHPGFQDLVAHDGVRTHGALPFSEFRELLAAAHVSIDLFSWNLEREHAMVTRAVVALTCGVPVVHPPFTEVAGFIDDYEAGWLIDPEDTDAVEGLLKRLADAPAELAARREGARRLAREVFAPPVAVRSLAELVGARAGP